ncbi:MAG: hypothetical protein ACI9IL_000126 [Rickettsiales bacterium]|jgi:hypothetical protein
MPASNWALIVSQLEIHFPKRLKLTLHSFYYLPIWAAANTDVAEIAVVALLGVCALKLTRLSILFCIPAE